VTGQLPRKNSLNITIVCGKPAEDAVLSRELVLVKSTLLYSDRITLASPSAAIFSSYTRVIRGSTAERLSFVARIADELGTDSPSPEAYREVVRNRAAIDSYQALTQKEHPSPEDESRLEELESTLLPWLDRLEQNTFDMMGRAGLGELGIAMTDGLLEVDNLYAMEASLAGLDEHEVVAAAFRGRIVNSLSDPGTLPLFDSEASRLAAELAERGFIAQASPPHSLDPGVAASLLAGLPGLPDLPMDEVLSIRDKTGDSRRRFQSAVRSAAAAIEGAPWEVDFKREAQRIHDLHVAPALAELEESLHDRSVMRIVRRVATAPSVVPAAVVFGAQAFAGPVEQAALYGLGSLVVSALVQELKDLSKLRTTARRNGFFLLHEVQERLKKNPGGRR